MNRPSDQSSLLPGCSIFTERDLAMSFCADIENMKGSTIDSMSEAVDNAAVMLFCCTLAYKESASENDLHSDSDLQHDE